MSIGNYGAWLKRPFRIPAVLNQIPAVFLWVFYVGILRWKYSGLITSEGEEQIGNENRVCLVW